MSGITVHYESKTVNIYSASSEPQAAVNAMLGLYKPEGCFYDWVIHKTYYLA